jgi:hypothetical protein
MALRRSAMVVMVAAIGVSAFLAAAAIFVVASHQSAGREGPSAEPAASAISRAPVAAAGVPAMQAQAPRTTVVQQHAEAPSAVPQPTAEGGPGP